MAQQAKMPSLWRQEIEPWNPHGGQGLRPDFPGVVL